MSENSINSKLKKNISKNFQDIIRVYYLIICLVRSIKQEWCVLLDQETSVQTSRKFTTSDSKKCYQECSLIQEIYQTIHLEVGSCYGLCELRSRGEYFICIY